MALMLDLCDHEVRVTALTELKGRELGTRRIEIERGPVRVFAQACKDDNPLYWGENAPVPPTFPFVMAYWGSLEPAGPVGLPIDKLRGPGRFILHGEQEFQYYRWPKVGDVLDGTTRVKDVYEKSRANGGSMEFYVTETEWRYAQTGEPACTSLFTLIVNVAPSPNA
jgi:hypothetical protein